MSTETKRPRCIDTTAKGELCRMRAYRDGADRCVSHAAAAGDADARALASEAGRKGAAAQQENAERNKRTTCSLRTADDRLSELERLLLQVWNSGGKQAQKAPVLVSIIKEAGAVQKSAELEEMNDELREMLIELRPDLRKTLKAV